MIHGDVIYVDVIKHKWTMIEMDVVVKNSSILILFFSTVVLHVMFFFCYCLHTRENSIEHFKCCPQKNANIT